MNDREARHVQKLRRAELECVRRFFTPGLRVLEVGGGTGYQASILASWGCHVISIDIGITSAGHFSHFPVLIYDGRRMPFRDASFDAVFSSNVLEHVTDLNTLFAEIKRVLRPGGLGVHIVPSAVWRLWTSLMYYVHIVRRIARVSFALVPRESSLLHDAQRLSQYHVKRLVAPAHGVYPSALSELVYFRARHWRRMIGDCGFEIVSCTGNGVFYTGYAICKWLPMKSRRLLAGILGSSCHIFVTSYPPIDC